MIFFLKEKILCIENFSSRKRLLKNLEYAQGENNNNNKENLGKETKMQ